MRPKKPVAEPREPRVSFSFSVPPGLNIVRCRAAEIAFLKRILPEWVTEACGTESSFNANGSLLLNAGKRKGPSSNSFLSNGPWSGTTCSKEGYNLFRSEERRVG